MLFLRAPGRLAESERQDQKRTPHHEATRLLLSTPLLLKQTA